MNTPGNQYNVALAEAPDGTMLPVIDLTDPRFRISESPAALDAAKTRYFAAERKKSWLTKATTDVMLRNARRRSRLIQAISESRGSYLPGLSTYILKLGPDNLVPPFDSSIDRAVAASLPVLSMRARLQQLAELMRDALVPALQEKPGAPLVLVNIAGGPAIDSINVLALLHARDSQLLAGRSSRVLVVDTDESGPEFGRRAVASLQEPGRALHGLDVSLESRPVRWQDTAAIEAVLASLPGEAIVIAHSEGGLFEYGTDGEIVAVLRTLAPRTDMVAGTVTRGDAETREMYAKTHSMVHPRGLEAFARLASEGGYRVQHFVPAAFSDQVLLRRE